MQGGGLGRPPRMCVCVRVGSAYVCVCERERERERGGAGTLWELANRAHMPPPHFTSFTSTKVQILLNVYIYICCGRRGVSVFRRFTSFTSPVLVKKYKY